MLSWKKRSLLVWPLAMIVMVGSSWPSAEAFVTGPRFPVRQHSRTAAPLAGFLDDIGQFFEELSEKKSKGSLKDGTSKLSTDSSIRDETDFTANYQIISIPAVSMKLGGLRLYMTFYFMGVQNTPEKGTWKAIQSDDNTLDMYFTDQSAALTMRFSENSIDIERRGTSPSMKYMLQESVLLNGILDELNACVVNGDIRECDRLLVLPKPGNAIENARDALAFA